MAGQIQELTGRATDLGAALIVYGGDDKVLAANDHHKSLYSFIDYSNPGTYGDLVRGCVRHNKLDDRSVYESPERWIGLSARFRRLNRFSQSLTRHTDGRIVQVTYERLEGSGGWWYQMRRDVTASVLQRIRAGRDPLGLFDSDDATVPPIQSTFLARLLDTLPHPAALLTTHRQLIDGNFPFTKILSRGDGMVMTGGRLCVRDTPEVQRDFAKRVAGFHRRRTRAPVTVRVPRLDRQTPYFVTLSEPPTSKLGWEAPAAGVLLLTVTDPDSLPAIAPRTIADLLQITGTEAQVALALSAGHTIGEIAAERGVEQRFINTLVKSILSKTGFCDQGTIVRQTTALSYVFGSRV